VSQHTVIRFDRDQKIRHKSHWMNRAVTDGCKGLDAKEKGS
jgi:hypothetical protein